MLAERLALVLGERYRVTRELGAGGMARVFVAHDHILARDVVVKVLPPEQATAVAVERFQREARLLAKLNHPHIVPVLDSGQRDGLFWFAMPLIEGRTLADRIAADGRLTTEEVNTLARQLLDALGHAHRLGVVHRDIKPANVLMHSGHALLADFGVAQLTDDSVGDLTAEGVALGTLDYMAPEHRRTGQGSPQSDLWGLAATLYEGCTGVKWTTASSGDDPWNRVPARLKSSIRRGLAEKPEHRWPDATGFRKSLEHRGHGRLMLLGVAGAAVAALLLLQRHPAASSVAAVPPIDSADVSIEVTGDEPWEAEIARSAGIALEWLPTLRMAASGDAVTPVRRRVTIRRIEGIADTAFDIVARGSEGRLLMSARVQASSLDPWVWGHAIATRVVEVLFPERDTDFKLLPDATDDVQAYRAWYDGSLAFQAGNWEEAERSFRDALRRDQQFILAEWSLLLARMWQRESYQDELERLYGNRARFPDPIGALLAAQMDANLSARLARFDSLAAAHPSFAPARMLHANELFHRGPLVGRSLTDGVTAFVSAAEEVSDLDHRTTWEHVLWGANRLGDRELAERAWHRLGEFGGDQERTGFLGLALQARFGTEQLQQSAALARSGGVPADIEALIRYLRFGIHFDVPGLVVQMAASIPAEAATAPAHAVALLAEGRLREALAVLDRAPASGDNAVQLRLQAAEWRLLLPRFGFALDSADRQAARGTLIRFAAEPRYWQRVVWALAVTADDRGEARLWLDSLSRNSTVDALAAHLIDLARAQVIAAESGPAAALAASEAIHVDIGDDGVLARGPLARAVTFHSRGQWRLALGDSQGALREWLWHENNDLQGWPSGPPQDGELDAALGAQARLLRAALLCASGNVATGRALRERVEQLWVRADRELAAWQPRVDAAETCR